MPAVLLLDTQLLLWAAFEPERLSAKAAKTLSSRAQPLALSMASLWEVAIKTSLARSDFVVDPALLHQALLHEGLVELPIRVSHLAHLATLHGCTVIRSTACSSHKPRPRAVCC